jgi:hypothetical protein
MRTTEARQLEALRSVQAFLDEYQHRFPAIAASGMRRRLDEELASLAQHADDQTASAGGSRACTLRYRALRRRLVGTHLVPIALIARVTKPSSLSELEQFQVPTGKPTARRLAAAAHAMADAAAPHAGTFIAAGMPRDFIQALLRASDAMTAELTARAQEWSRHRIATEALRSGITSARRVVSVLDAFVRSECEADPTMLAGWETVTHVRRTARRTQRVPELPQPSLDPVVTESGATPTARSIEPASTEHRPVALPRRMFALLANRGRRRIPRGALQARNN